MIIKNRFGRIVDVSDEQGRDMIKHDGATLFEEEKVVENKVNNPLECPYCSKVCANQLGFNKHTEACKKKANLSQS